MNNKSGYKVPKHIDKYMFKTFPICVFSFYPSYLDD